MSVALTLQVCRKCLLAKAVGDFGWHDPVRKTRRHVCKACVQAQQAIWIEKHRETVNARSKRVPRAAKADRHRRWYRRNLPANMWRAARDRAQRDGIPFDLEVSDIFVPEYCPVLGLKLEVSTTGKPGGADASPSLDRLRPERGYVRGNVRVISWRANRIKCNGTAAELQRVAAWMRSEGLP